MKKILFYACLVFFQVACEDVIDVNLPQTESRLVVNALFRVDINEEFVPVAVSVTKSSNFFEDVEVTQLSSAVIFYGIPLEDDPTIFEETFSSSLAESSPGSGVYIPDPNFSSDQRIRTSSLEPGMVFNLIMEHEGERFFAQTTYVPTVPIDKIEQGTETLFSGEETELIITFSDDADRDDFYVFDFDFNEFLVTEDEFYQGQTFEFSYFYDNELQPGTELEISIIGADEAFYNYMNQLIIQSGGDQGPFQTPAATVRGNILNATGIDNIQVFDNVERAENFALGYFAVVQEFSRTITIE